MSPHLRADLTGFAALVGESFQSRVDLLERLLQARHYPSLGTYKERLLAQSIRTFIPKAFEVGTGFVMFPCEGRSGPFRDMHNQSDFDVSRQCDIIVYDAFNHPPVFQDGDFVVLRPESVKAVIEVKGSITRKSISDCLLSMLDFAKKWQTTQIFYRNHHQAESEDPQLHCFGWNTNLPKNDKLGRRLASIISEFYRDNVDPEEFGSLPLLDSLMLYNEWDVSNIQGIGPAADHLNQVGWYSRRGKFIRSDHNETLYLDRDRTVSSLLSRLHLPMGFDKFNRFFSYTDEVRSGSETAALDKQELVWAWELPDNEAIRRLNSSTPPGFSVS